MSGYTPPCHGRWSKGKLDCSRMKKPGRPASCWVHQPGWSVEVIWIRWKTSTGESGNQLSTPPCMEDDPKATSTAARWRSQAGRPAAESTSLAAVWRWSGSGEGPPTVWVATSPTLLPAMGAGCQRGHSCAQLLCTACPWCWSGLHPGGAKPLWWADSSAAWHATLLQTEQGSTANQASSQMQAASMRRRLMPGHKQAPTHVMTAWKTAHKQQASHGQLTAYDHRQRRHPGGAWSLVPKAEPRSSCCAAPLSFGLEQAARCPSRPCAQSERCKWQHMVEWRMMQHMVERRITPCP